MSDGSKRYSYEYPRPAVTVDVMCLRADDHDLEILLIERKSDPFRGSWALPGGFVDIDEDLEPAARRELAEETGLAAGPMRQFGTFGRPDRDPRGRTISVAFLTWFRDKGSTLRIGAADDATDAKWFSIQHLPDLAFDHREIITRGLESARQWRRLGELAGLEHAEF